MKEKQGKKHVSVKQNDKRPKPKQPTPVMKKAKRYQPTQGE
ncbi:MAG: hypothetical protein WC668_01160 [Patescibacteria group bacterium]|jgi:hypothetical protein